MVKYDTTGLVHYTDGRMLELHGFIFVSSRPSDAYFKYEVSSFFLGWDNEIFCGYPSNSFLKFKYWDNHGMDGADESLRLQNEQDASKTLVSGSNTIIMDKPLIQNPAKFALPDAMRLMCSGLSSGDEFDYFDLVLHKVSIPQQIVCKGWFCNCKTV